jgi:predicted membrane protein
VKFDSRDVALTAVFASLYAVVNIIQTAMGGPVTYGPIQLRLADCLIPLSALFGWPQVLGVAVGCFSNAYYWLDPADVIVGPVVNLAAAILIMLLRRQRVVACVSGALTVGVPIGLYLYYLYTQGNPIMRQQIPEFPGPTLPLWSAFILSLTISSLVTVGVIGYILLTFLSRSSIIEPLKSRGLKVVAENEYLHESF